MKHGNQWCNKILRMMMEDRAVEMRRAVVRKDFPLIVEVTILHSR